MGKCNPWLFLKSYRTHKCKHARHRRHSKRILMAALARAHKKMTAQSKGVSSTSREKTLRRSTLQIHDTWKEVEIMRKLHCLWHLDCKPVFLLSMQVKASCHTYFYQWKKIEGLSKSRPLTLNAFIFSIYVWPHFLTFFTHCVCCILFSIQWLDDIFLEQLGKS